jgi:hypothetical protein
MPWLDLTGSSASRIETRRQKGTGKWQENQALWVWPDLVNLYQFDREYNFADNVEGEATFKTSLRPVFRGWPTMVPCP